VDPSGDRTPPADRVAEIRAEIEGARARLVGTLDALWFKADVPARLGDSVGAAASAFTAHLIDRLTSSESKSPPEDPVVTIPVPDGSNVAREVDQGAG
jgi:Protein of unknown function (DUF3618)